MPRRPDLQSICVIGAGPIVIGQACEFDYSGSQALKVLRAEGYRTIVVNSNPATIMTDPGYADRTYLEPLDVEGLTGVLQRERPDALLPTLGGGTALDLARRLTEEGVLAELGIELIGASYDAIRRAEDRGLFRETMGLVGLRVPESVVVTSPDELPEALSFPLILRPAFTLGGHGGGIARSPEELDRLLERALSESPVRQVLVEESLVGWDEFELEVMRDGNDNVVVICSIENLDPMGVHTGDSVTVAPQMTLSDEAFQELRDAAARVIRAVGVETGGSNIQFAREREGGEVRVIEMNPRVSRSSALASKATGYPIAKVAAKLAVGYTLDEIPNDLTQTTPASFEPTLDYVVVKFPRFAFEKFPGADEELGTQMKSVGEAMGIGRTFTEAFLKAMRSRELDPGARTPWATLDDLPEGLHPWFREQLDRARTALASTRGSSDLVAADWLRLKRAGWSDADLAEAWGETEHAVRRARRGWGVRPAYRRVDSCAAEVEASSNYLYSTWGEEDESRADGERPRVVILGSGPNRIGQGIEFDYCCVHAVRTFASLGYETIMVNCNPETVSTDYDTSDRLYFEPLRVEEVLEICAREQPEGVVIQFGGQTPLKLARALEDEGIPILGTPYEAVDLAEDRERFADLCGRLGIDVPAWRMADDPLAAVDAAEAVGYPVLVRPSYVLGGRRMRVCYGPEDVAAAAEGAGRVLVDRFLEGAVELDVDALCDGEETWVAALMEHVEEAGVHSGDSSCVLPPVGLPDEVLADCVDTVTRLAPALGVVGLINVQLALQDGRLYVLEANPRASRTVPFVSKALGVNLAAAACRLAAGGRPGRRARGRAPGARTCLREGLRVSVRPLPRRRRGARPRDALDGGGDGERRRLPHRVRQSRARGRPAAPERRDRVPLRPRRGQARRGRPRAQPRGAGVRAVRDRRHGQGARRRRARSHALAQGFRAGRRPHRRRPRPAAQDRACRQHARRQGGALGRLPDPRGGAARPRAVRDDDLGRRGRGRGDCARDPRRDAVAPGTCRPAGLGSSRSRPSARTRSSASGAGASSRGSPGSSSCCARPACCSRGP